MKAKTPTLKPLQSSVVPLEFSPFYWRMIQRTGYPVLAQWCVAIGLGLAFLLPHLGITPRHTIHSDLSWMLGLLISAAVLLLYYATSTLIELLAEADLRMSINKKNQHITSLLFWLSDFRFIMAGTSFGVLNCVMGYLFGVRYATLPSYLTIYWGFFLVGFVCGTAAYGLCGVFGFMRGLVAAEPALDYRNPDNCGGTSFLGEAIVKFSLVNLIMGVLISIYIVYAPWTNREHIFVKLLIWAWIGFPFLISIAHLVGPGLVIHRFLKCCKKREQRLLFIKIKKICADIETAGTRTRDLREELEYELKLQSELYKMNTWPFLMASAVHYSIGFCANTIPACLEAMKMLHLDWRHLKIF